MCYIVFIPYGCGINRNEGRIGEACLLVGFVTSARTGPVTAAVTMGLLNRSTGEGDGRSIARLSVALTCDIDIY